MEPTQAVGIAGFLTQTDSVGKAALIVLLLMSVATWYLIITKSIQWLSARRRTEHFLATFWDAPSLQAVASHLEERYPDPPLLPQGFAARGYVRAAALLIACDIHPLANLRVLRHLKHELGHSQDEVDSWYRHWVEDGLARLEAYLVAERRSGRFVLGDRPTIADCCLVPQMFNARRLSCDVTPFPTLVAIDAHCAELDAFQRAHPSVQPDAE